jgi:hypothetical protein
VAIRSRGFSSKGRTATAMMKSVVMAIGSRWPQEALRIKSNRGVVCRCSRILEEMLGSNLANDIDTLTTTRDKIRLLAVEPCQQALPLLFLCWRRVHGVNVAEPRSCRNFNGVGRCADRMSLRDEEVQETAN